MKYETFDEIQVLGKVARDLTIQYMKSMREFVVKGMNTPDNKAQMELISSIYGMDAETVLRNFSMIIETMEGNELPFSVPDIDTESSQDANLGNNKHSKRF